MTIEKFETNYEASKNRVYRFAYQIAGNREDAEDLTQEAFTRAFRAIDAFSDAHSFESWMFKIVRNLFLDLLRRRQRRVVTISYQALMEDGTWSERPDTSHGPDYGLLSACFEPEIVEALEDLRPSDRQLLVWLHQEDFSYAEIGRKLGLQSSVIRARAHRAHASLRKHYLKRQGLGRSKESKRATD